MEKEAKPANIEKFLKLEENKRDRIINAALKEFSYGYKKASTDSIVKEAGISKGLLYHYFGTKEQLYKFLGEYVVDLMKTEYYDMLNTGISDALEIVWQSALLHKDISDRYPAANDFADSIYTHREDIPSGLFSVIWKKQENIFDELYERFDLSLFRDDIDPEKAIDLVFWAVGGFFIYFSAKTASLQKGDTSENYEKFLEELRNYLNVFRLCFYKN